MLFLYRSLVLEEGEGRSVLEARKERRKKKLGESATLGTWSFIKLYGSRLVGTGT